MRRTLLALSIILTVFVVGFLAGKQAGDNYLSTEQRQFEANIKKIEDKIAYIDWVNHQLKNAYHLVRTKNTVTINQEQNIQEYERRIVLLSQEIAREQNPVEKERLKTELFRVHEELDRLRVEYEKVQQETSTIKKNIGETNKLLTDKNSQIEKLSADTETDRSAEIEKSEDESIKKLRQQVEQYELGGFEEYNGDVYKGKNKKEIQDQYYAKAYRHFENADAKYDMQRVLSKINSKRTQEQLSKSSPRSTN